ncbi:MAG: hypothetical protein QXS21_00165 [Thermoproteota archaeon]|nr:hypothetical protein [Candidatus Brockarchaeota archaeon]MBO3767926.1 hypothetical protein [Candidatus Brockarchaeota archaeon]MBO3800928.1 hypothetical protein [Candidatus Brockarchaeota archaeon]
MNKSVTPLFSGNEKVERGVYVDPLLNTYSNFHLTPEKVAKLIKDYGFNVVHLVIVNVGDNSASFSSLISSYVKSFRLENLSVVLTIYPPTDEVAWKTHPEWRQRFLNGESKYDWRVYLAPTDDDFVAYYLENVRRLLKEYNFNGIELAECWYEVDEGPSSPYYADFSSSMRQKFKEASGVDPLELFNSSSPYYYLKNSQLYEEWVNFRVKVITNFMKKILSVAKEVNPNIKTYVMYLSDVGQNYSTRIDHAQDLNAIVRDVKPDYIVIETAWQDWIKADLSPSYVKAYADHYVSIVHNAQVKVIIQTDVGSIAQMKRSLEWVKEFSNSAIKNGFDGVVFYEFSIGSFVK